MLNNYELYNNYKTSFETPDDGYSYFFGYYDKSPLNIDNTKLLSHRVSFDGRDVKDGDIADIGYFDLSTKEFIKLDETLAWNWQQGSQLQWLPPKFDEEIIYNSIKDDNFISIIYNIRTNKKRTIPFPIYVVHPNGKEALGINYERHYWCRYGYNYQNIKNKKWDKPYHKEDGVFKINLEKETVKLIVNIADIIENNKLSEFETCNNWLEHMMYNPSGDRFMFFHRWDKDNVDYSRVYTVDSHDGKNIFMYPDVGFYSHYFWKENKYLSIWTYESKNNNSSLVKTSNFVKKSQVLKVILKPLYKLIKSLLSTKIKSKITNESKLLVFKDKTNDYTIIGDDVLFGNGHQSWFSDKKRLLNDTYQDNENYRHLMVFNTANSTFDFIGKFYSLYNDSAFRCDLHPRLSKNNKILAIDSAHKKNRKIILIKIDKD